MAIAHVHTDTSGGTASAGSSISVTLPTGIAATDVALVAFGTNEASGGATAAITGPSGWTRVGPSSLFRANDGVNEVGTTAFWALGNVANLSFTVSNLTGNSVAWACAAFSGVDNGTPIDVQDTTGASTTGATSVNSPSVTIATANAWMCLASCDFNGGTLTATGFTTIEASSSFCTATLFYNQTPKSTGGTGAQTVTSSASATGEILPAFSFALRPAASAGQVPWDIPHSPQHQAMVAM